MTLQLVPLVDQSVDLLVLRDRFESENILDHHILE